MTISRKQQRGFSLIELMVAMTLGLILIGVSVQYLFGAKVTFDAVNTTSRVQENARFALELLATNIRMAGYADPTVADQPPFFLTSTGACVAGNPCTGNDVGPNNSDQIAVWLNPPPDDDTDQDCQGNTVNGENYIANLFFVDDPEDDGIFTLYCRAWTVDGTFASPTTSAVSAAQPFIDGIESLQAQYGVTDGNGVTRYVSADQVTDWVSVSSVKILLLTNSGVEVGTALEEERTYDLLDATPLTLEDKFARKTFTTTVVLNNANF